MCVTNLICNQCLKIEEYAWLCRHQTLKLCLECKGNCTIWNMESTLGQAWKCRCRISDAVYIYANNMSCYIIQRTLFATQCAFVPYVDVRYILQSVFLCRVHRFHLTRPGTRQSRAGEEADVDNLWQFIASHSSISEKWPSDFIKNATSCVTLCRICILYL